MVQACVKQKRSKKFWKIDLVTLPYKIHFFLYFGAAAGFIPFLTVFTKSKLNLTDGQVASLFASYQLITIFTKPVIGLIVDYFNKLKLVIIVLSILVGSLALVLLFLPGIEPVPHEEDGNSNRTSHSAFLLKCDFDFTPTACRLIQSFCLNSKKINPSIDGLSSFSIAANSDDSIPCIRSDEFKFCQSNKDLLPHSVASNNFKCTKLRLDSDEDDDTRKCVHFTKVSTVRNENITFALIETELDSGRYRPKDGFEEVVTLCSSASSPSLYIEDHTELVMYSSKYPDDVYFKCKVSYPGYSDCNIFNGLVKTLDELSDDVHSKNTEIEKVSPYTTYQFWILAFVLLCSGTCSNALFTLSDTACHEILHKTGADYGRQRVWGAVGWGLMSAAAGYLNDIASEYSILPEYSAGFFTCAVFCVLIVLNVCRLDLVKPDMPKSAKKDMKALLKNTEFIIFETGVFLTGFFVSVMWFYLTVFVGSIGGDKLLMGLLATSQSFLGVIPFMFFSGWILSKIGHMNAMILTFICYAIRFFCYHMVPNPWWILPVEVVHGICYGLFYTALTSFAKLSAPTGAEATTQSLLCCIYEGLGAGLGCIVVGISFDVFGDRETFLVLAICACAAAVLQFLAAMYVKSRKKTIKISHKKSSISSIT